MHLMLIMVSRHSDSEIMSALGIDSKTLQMFKKVQGKTLKEAKALAKKKTGKITVLGISGSARDEFDMSQESSSSEALLKACLKKCEKLGAKTELVPLRKFSIQHCKACYSTVNTQCHFYCTCYPKGTPQGDDMSNKLYDKILKADAIIFATPVNNFKISTLMAAFIDRCISLDGSLSPADPKSPKNRELNKKHMQFIELTADSKIPGSGMLKRFTGKTAGIITTSHEEGASMAISSLFMTLNHYGMSFPPFSNSYAMASICNATSKDKPIVLSECNVEEVELLAENVMNSARILRKEGPNKWVFDNSKN
ncbi:MAG: flavodoxin family protein [Candidatus Diapherotrites archaeon]|nr:flavodoxin family protein [Candidatus Diapherotrites archaeon]